MIALALAAGLACSTAAVDAFTASHDPQVLPVRPCFIEGGTGPLRCDRKHGCLKCEIYVPCPELRL
jgi:hypothetical protein